VLVASCSGSGVVDPRTLPTIPASGIWTSTAAVGELGNLRLELDQREDSRVFDAVLSFPDRATLGDSNGFGTLADAHLILDFDAGDRSEFFFEGAVAGSGAAGSTITGQLVFPDQQATLAVTFSYSSALPPDPD
jgi:hypothetical protein